MFDIKNIEMKLIGFCLKLIRFGFNMLVNNREVILYCEFDTVTGNTKWYASNSMFVQPIFIKQLLFFVQPELDVYLQSNQVKQMMKTKNNVFKH